MAESFRSDCPVARALDVVGDKWTLLLVRDMIAGKETYRAFLEAGEGIPTNILAARLKRLVAAGLVEKRAYQERPVRYAYLLTAAGRGLVPVVAALGDWGAAELGGVVLEGNGGGGLKPALREVSETAPRQNEWAFGPEDSVW